MISKVPLFAHKSSQRCRLSSQRTLALDRRVTLFSALDDIVLSFDPSHAAAASAATGIDPVRSFEPVLNVQAASSFVFIAIVFAVLQLRINAVSKAAKRRSDALLALRVAESVQLSDPTAGHPVVARARVEYENALREELGLRTIVPGVRIVAPNDPRRDEEERAAAKRFLGWEKEDFGDDYDEGGNIDNGSVEKSDKTARSDESGDVGLSVGAKFILFGVASMLIVLLWTLSFDPMAANTIFFG
ncbi:hypothetical protein ACHAXA_000419 [Cyclostephanos tholiformis]|uniref:Uncharacterized protein n=1 Tax=Cyclostephanos tholiformis TaxID=382380 RepID=A0ABD3RTS4_9STRA